MLTVKVKLKKSVDDSYSIVIKSGLFEDVPGLLENYPSISGWAIISDDNVARLYGNKLLQAVRKKVKRAELFTFPAGERSKNRKMKAKIEDEMFSAGLGRDSAVIALGGGVTGDLAGFVSATYMRGIPYIQVPTTLLAMVDSSIGGKTAVDVEAGKNLIGAFHQPKAVFIDPCLLATLPARQIKNGLAEMVKHAVIADDEFFSFLKKNLRDILKLDGGMIEKALMWSCEIKADVVEKDEKEAGLRQILNYGHTVGHALEKLSKYKLLHGEAVAVGMIVEGFISWAMGFMKINELERQNELIAELGFSSRALNRFEASEIIYAMRADKKVRKGEIRMVLPKRVGEMMCSESSWSFPIKESLIKKAVKHACDRRAI